MLKKILSKLSNFFEKDLDLVSDAIFILGDLNYRIC